MPGKTCCSAGGRCNNRLPPSGGATTMPHPSPTVQRFDDMSAAEMLSTEVMKRFANPDWYKEQAERSFVPLLIEYLHMRALEQYLDFHKQRVRERIEVLLATQLARWNRLEMEKRLQRQREVAAKAGKLPHESDK